ncbi:MAG: papain-like cysteine protease family protein [Collinsella sp.]|uniref:C39 family peptidase n=1 Tax=Collinsella sp. TaxID=1965294 RepID=UPI002E76D2EE|nr:C39 family peptidase [Collinsella sp.]MEE0703834.1 papain-like cysteine protease family protein [Collinsella sp.]
MDSGTSRGSSSGALRNSSSGAARSSNPGASRGRNPGTSRNPSSSSLRNPNYGSPRNPNFGAARGSGLSGKRGRSHGYVDGSRRWSAFKSSRVTHPHLRSNRIFARATWIDRLLQPRVIVAVLALVLVGGGGLAIYSSAQQRAAEEAAQAEAAAEKKRLANQAVNPNKLGVGAYAVSTPRSEWTQGTMPHLYQTDPAWANKSYAGGTVRANACGPTSLTMVYIYLTGRTDLDPGAMAAFADENNFAPTGATEWSFMTEGASMLGINSAYINPSRRDITNALANGRPVICSVSPGDFTTVGHYIVLRSIDDRGMVEVFDPNSPYNSARRWGIQEILNQTQACWSFWV